MTKKRIHGTSTSKTGESGDNKIRQIHLLGRATPRLSEDEDTEVAFIGGLKRQGRKDSLVNMLTNRKNVAKVSKTPKAKRKRSNHYEITTGDGKWFLVDLPGYGFANAPERLKREWAKFTFEYLLREKELNIGDASRRQHGETSKTGSRSLRILSRQRHSSYDSLHQSG